MQDKKLATNVLKSAIGFAVFLVVCLALMDALNGGSLNLVGPLVSGLVGGAVYGVLAYALMRRRLARQA